MKRFILYKKPIALFFSILMGMQLFVPLNALALTSGPSQPEMKGFEPISNADMVDLFTGDFSYNIPLMDVGGYPINMSYHSGAGMDEEASWIGYGWTLNPGVLNRQLRGLPDDFNGQDTLSKEMNIKDHVTKGAKVSVSLDLLGIPKSEASGKKKKQKFNFKVTTSLGIKLDNYRGIGMELGANTGLSLTTYSALDKNAGEVESDRSLGSLNLNLSSFDGASAGINADIIKKNLGSSENSTTLTKSLGFSYNSRAGLAGMTLTNSFNSRKASVDEKTGKLLKEGNIGGSESSFISFNGDTYTPTVDMPSKSNSFTFSLNLGPEAFIFYVGTGVTGFYSKQTLVSKQRSLPGFGYFNSEKGKDEPEALLDFNREKDIPYNKDVNYLPIPVPTNDLFMATSQDGAGQYRAYRGSSGVLFDHKSEGRSNDYSLGIEVGAGGYFDVGADLFFQTMKTTSQKWKKRNDFLATGDFQTYSASNPLLEPAYFKRVGESVMVDADYYQKIQQASPIAVTLPKSFSNAISGASASNKLTTRSQRGGLTITSALQRDKREIRNQPFTFLPAREAAHHALDSLIYSYTPDSLRLSGCTIGNARTAINRVGSYRKAHHMSEITITGTDGKRMIYGIPVYNTYQEEVSFSVPEDTSRRKRGVIGYQHDVDNSTGNSNGRDNYYSRDITPPYTTSFLLTGILSPDYIDRTGDGITDDDLGTAVKFNYTKLPFEYQWRTPYDSANYNEGFLSDHKDDKASYVYGKKEVWYVHSIESKTMVAQFILEDRNDGLGVLGPDGGKDSTHRLKRLKEIRLFSKSDLQLNNNNPQLTTPIKVVHFEYNYSVCKGIPNSVGGAGKLTLKKVYFTFGFNGKGRLHPYEFYYDTTHDYALRQFDRWGNFKDANDNPNGLSNSEFPYVLQDSSLNADYAKTWQLNRIDLPSGGSISVTYESDDYAYVQDKRASQMCMVSGINTANGTAGLVQANDILVNLPVAVNNEQEMKYRYFRDGNKEMDKLYFKFLLDLDGVGHKEYVPGYASISSISYVNSTTARITLNKIGGINPIAKAGWQFLRTQLPAYAYPGYDNADDSGGDLVKAIKALLNALGSIKELVYGFEARAKNKGFSDNAVLEKSWVRLYTPSFKKYGGGLRVKRIDMSDDWANMSGTAGAVSATYTQLFSYTKETKDNLGNTITISSGVASYEPMIGNDENPFRQPVTYKQKQFLGLDNYFYIEQPFCESYYPAATVGYSRVSVKNIGTGDDESANRTGVTVSEFYTAKDYPTKVDWLPLERRKPALSNILKLVSAKVVDHLGLSQGYTVELNDMHGKPKSVSVLNRSGQKISSVDYMYQTVNENAEQKQLSNNVKLFMPDGTMGDGLIGMDVEVFTDMREQTTDNLGISVKVSGGSGAALFFPLPFFFPGIGVNYEKRSYRAASTIKIINRFAILQKVRKMENGSTITTENLLYDPQSGDVLLTKTQNEFDDPIYSFSYLARWAYDGMGQAYKSIGTVMEGFSSDAGGKVLNSVYRDLLQAGDELIDMNSQGRYWVIFQEGDFDNPFGIKKLIGEDGNTREVSNLRMRLIRPARRNMNSAVMATVVSLKNPFDQGVLNITNLTKVLDAKGSVFSEEWSSPVRIDCSNQVSCVEGCTLAPDSSYCYKTKYAPLLDSIKSNVTATYCPIGLDPYAEFGTLIYDSSYASDGSGGNPVLIDEENEFWINGEGDQTHGPLNRAGIWPCTNFDEGGFEGGSESPWLGFTIYISAPESKRYYVGISGDNLARLYVNDTLKVQFQDDFTFHYWHIFPIYLHAGSNLITVQGKNFGSAASFGAEIYNNTAEEIAAATGYNQLDVIFSTANLTGHPYIANEFYKSGCPYGYSIDSSGSPVRCKELVICSEAGSSIGSTINPYKAGIIGNWRMQKQFVYHGRRKNVPGNDNITGSTNIRKSGFYETFAPLYSFIGDGAFEFSGGDENWIMSSEVTKYNGKGLEVENKDALNRYSSALFGYLESLPVAVASNTRFSEMGYDGFEDYGFSLDCNEDTCSKGHFSFKKLLKAGTVTLSGNQSHSGTYSLKLSSGSSVTLNKSTSDDFSVPLYTRDPVTSIYSLGSNDFIKGFAPLLGKKYVISLWVKDGSPRTTTTDVQVKVNNVNLVSGITKYPVVEGWKRIEAVFTQSSQGFTLQMTAGGSDVYVDDIRIHPFDGQMKTFAYDPSSQRLIAEMDENNFATFYEYDDEGILLRVKKETERGIMTIKETRSSYKRKQ